MSKLHTGGFTLIEVMIVIGIVVTLMMVALPSYQNYVRKAKRSVGRAELLTVLARQEQFYILNKHYAPRLELLGSVDSSYSIDSSGANVAVSSPRGIYSISLIDALPEGLPQEFILRATPQRDQQLDLQCGVLEVSSVGIKSAGRGSVFDCW